MECQIVLLLKAIPMNGPSIQQLFDLTGKTALITGASGFLGSALSRALAEAGASVVVGSRDAKRAADVVAQLPSPGGAVHHGVALDQMDETSLQSATSCWPC